MRTSDFSNYLFRCSSLGRIMSGVKPNLTKKQEDLLSDLKEKQKINKITDSQIITLGKLIEQKKAKPKLSTGAKSYLQDLHKREMTGRQDQIRSKYLDKGIQVEEQSLTLYSKVYGKLLIKNKKRYTNEYLTGEPDNTQEIIRDIKSSWDIMTFPLYDEEVKNHDYLWQGQGYMELTGLKMFELIYCLVDTPAPLIEDEKRRTAWKLALIDLPQELEAEIVNNLTYSDLPMELRVKVFKEAYSSEKITLLYKYLDLARIYLNELSKHVANNLK